LHSRALEHGISSNSGLSGAVEAKPALATPTSSESVSLSRPSLLPVGGATDASELKVESVGEGSTSVSSEISGSVIIVDSFETAHHAKLDESSLQNEELRHETVSKDEQGESRLPELEFKQDVQSSEISSEPVSLKSSELIKHTEGKHSGKDSDPKAITTSDEVPTLETSQRGLAEPVECHAEMDGTTDFSDAGSSNGEKASTLDVPSRSDSIGSKEVVTMSGISDQQSAILTPDLLEATSKHEGEIAENFGGSLVSFAASVSKDKPSLDLSKAKNSAKGGKKKMKEILQKADAAGTTSDLYNAYKGLDEKKETAVSTESTESTSNIVDVKQAPADAVEVDSIASEMGGTSKAELDDWEDAADISTPKLEVSDNGQQVIGRLDNHDKDEEVVTAKKSSRDFLLKFTEQYLVLPKGFEITSETETLMSANFNISHHVERDSYPSPGRIIDRPSGGSRIERRGSGAVEEDRWSELSGNFSSGRDPRQVDEEQAKQRQIRDILNKLTPTNFEKLIEQAKAINIDNAATLISFVSQIFDRALMEPIYCEMYVNFCSHLAGKLPDFNEDNENVTFKRVLLNKCQQVFERGEREQEEANKAEEEDEIKQSAEQREEKRVKARRRMLGNILYIYKS
jgi:translation initiation factor 4G